MSAQDPNLPNATFKLKAPLANFSSGIGYAPYKPFDTKEDTKKVFRFSFYTVTGSYVLLYMWRRVKFNLRLPLAAVGFSTLFTGFHHALGNIREKNDSWNSFWGGFVGAATSFQIFYRHVPVNRQVMSTLAIAGLISVFDRAKQAQSTSTVAKEFSYRTKLESEAEPEKDTGGFWEVKQRRPLSETVERLGVGRGIFRP
ncbi:hypothetical protein JA1_003433 [Spathaspora sp. JA1]|nr:hypothetical protein JA1_003433 [Spathaspora sp. JA1]